MVNVANPIYDAVFKYLMEDARIAKTIISSLLKREVEEVSVRKHEYTNGTRDKISMFRIDFGAQVRQDDGSLKLVLIELQKTWLETETLRFRQYLGTQYADPDNLQKDKDNEGYGIPMITVYLLGHRVGDIEEPVLYVNHKSYDYNDNEVTKGMPDPFVESLVHDSIIVQIPLLRGQTNNRLEKVLSFFDQSHKDRYNRQILNINEDLYSEDEEMNLILHRLLSAASDAKVRQDMNVEEEFFMAIENRDTAIMMRDKRIEEQDQRIEEQGQRIEEQGQRIEEQGQRIEEQGQRIEEQGQRIEEQNKYLYESARALKVASVPIEQIATITNIPISEIEKL